jgi:acetone carboxylase gamma subunit
MKTQATIKEVMILLASMKSLMRCTCGELFWHEWSNLGDMICPKCGKTKEV